MSKIDIYLDISVVERTLNTQCRSTTTQIFITSKPTLN